MQVADAEDVGQLLGQHPAQEDEPGQVIVAARQDPLLEARVPGVQLVPAVVDLLAADHHEDHVGRAAGDPVGDPHEQVETADRLQPARDERHDPRSRRDRPSPTSRAAGPGR